MITAVLAFLTAVLAGLPQILKMIEKRQAQRTEETDALIRRDMDVLHGPPSDRGV